MVQKTGLGNQETGDISAAIWKLGISQQLYGNWGYLSSYMETGDISAAVWKCFQPGLVLRCSVL
jgi:hypothetical protein